jgi:CRP-like cAMP-binding protein
MPALTPDDVRVVSQIPVLSGLASKNMDTLIAQSTVLNLKSGQVVFRQGQSAAAFFIVLEGWLKLYRITPAGDIVVLNVLTKGESFAEAVAFVRGRYPVNAEAASSARVVRLPADHVVNCIREVPDIALAMIASTSMHLHQLVQQVEQLSAQSAVQRVAQFLVSLCASNSGPCTIMLPYDKSLIAGRLGLKPESLSRIFAKLRNVGVAVNASQVAVGDIAKLRDLIAHERISHRSSLC